MSLAGLRSEFSWTPCEGRMHKKSGDISLRAVPRFTSFSFSFFFIHEKEERSVFLITNSLRTLSSHLEFLVSALCSRRVVREDDGGSSPLPLPFPLRHTWIPRAALADASGSAPRSLGCFPLEAPLVVCPPPPPPLRRPQLSSSRLSLPPAVSQAALFARLVRK